MLPLSVRNALGLCSTSRRFAERCSALFFNRIKRESNHPSMNHVCQSSTGTHTGSGQAVTLSYERYDATSEGTPLVVIHGLFGSKRNWNSFCKAYNEVTGREIIAVVCRNHGRSEQSNEISYPLMCYDIEKTLTQLDIQRAAVIGHSLGGKVAMYMALSMPNLVEKLVIIDINSAPGTERLIEFQGLLQDMINLDLSQVKSRRDADNILATTIPAPNLRAFLLTNLVKGEDGSFYWQINLKGFQQNFEELFKGVYLNGREKYEKETLFVAGGESGSLKVTDLTEIKELFPKARLEVIPGASHFVHTDKPKELSHILQRFLC